MSAKFNMNNNEITFTWRTLVTQKFPVIFQRWMRDLFSINFTKSKENIEKSYKQCKINKQIKHLVAV